MGQEKGCRPKKNEVKNTKISNEDPKNNYSQVNDKDSKNNDSQVIDSQVNDKDPKNNDSQVNDKDPKINDKNTKIQPKGRCRTKSGYSCRKNQKAYNYKESDRDKKSCCQ